VKNNSKFDANEINLRVASSPFMHTRKTITRVMGEVIIALIPAIAASIYFFGFAALKIISVSVVSCIFTEYLWQKIFKKRVLINDLSAFLTGILFALTLPADLQWWVVVCGAVFSIIAAKQIFGGLGSNILNPALAGRVFIQLLGPGVLSLWEKPLEAVTTAAPAVSASSMAQNIPVYLNMLFGKYGGSLGEVSAVLMIAGGVFLIAKKNIRAVIPFSYIITVASGALILGDDPVFQALAGGLMLVAFFMAVDPVTSPVSFYGKIIFGIGCGIFTVLIRAQTGMPESLFFSVLIMNLLVPAIDRITIPKPFGVN
jgi:Na+-translocating ferredoxin:NAD+ oxidoreductase subunit D